MRPSCTYGDRNKGLISKVQPLQLWIVQISEVCELISLLVTTATRVMLISVDSAVERVFKVSACYSDLDLNLATNISVFILVTIR